MKDKLNQIFDDLIGSEERKNKTDFDKIIMIMEEIVRLLDHKSDNEHQHTLI